MILLIFLTVFILYWVIFIKIITNKRKFNKPKYYKRNAEFNRINEELKKFDDSIEAKEQDNS